nr:MAG TPA: hypothetical protein [Caudoviricetes sp.]
MTARLTSSPDLHIRDGEALGGGAIKAESEFAVVDDGASDFLA